MAGRDLPSQQAAVSHHKLPASPENLAWQERAACRGRSYLFDQVEVQPALAVCRSCAVLTTCRAWALRTAVNGVAGGLTEPARRTWRAVHRFPEPMVDVSMYLPADVVLADRANELRPDRHLRLVSSN